MSQGESDIRTPRVLLVGFQDQDNLGLRYLSSSARAAGFDAEILSYQADPVVLIEAVDTTRPLAIGFSLIFQYMAPEFAGVIRALREAGVTAHITMGGHFPSFEPGEVLSRMPELDSIVRFEGERTLVELLEKLQAGEDWRGILGIAYRDGNRVVTNPLRPPVADLDTLPWPHRDDIDYETDPFPTASILGSRGCPWDCTFCSIRPFYEAQGGSLRRLRHPDQIVAEMAQLHRDRGVSIFLFQDDDFTAGGKKALKWAEDIAAGLVREGLAGKVAFKISCRADEVHEENMRKLAEGGLCHVYMGVESGDEEGLVHLRKRLSSRDHLEAARVLKALDMSFDFGFMLLEPYSTFDIVRHNIDFLEQFVGDGWTVACFCRMLPYAGTPVKTKLESEGRLLGTAFDPDYKFLDPKLDIFYDWMLETFHERNFTSRGLCHILKSLLFESHLPLPGRAVFDRLDRAYLHHLTSICNGLAFFTLRSAISYLEATPLDEIERDRSFLAALTQYEREEEHRLLGQVASLNWSARRGSRVDDTAGTATEGLDEFKPLGAFDRSWTISPPATAGPAQG